MLKKNVISSAFTQIGRIVLGFLINIVIARALGSTILGQVNYLFVVFGILGSYGHFGVLNATSYCYRNDKCDGDRQFRTNITYLVLNCALWLLLFSIPFVKQILLPDMSYIFVILGVAYVLVMYLNSALTEYCVADEKVYASNRTYLIGLAIATLGVVSLGGMGKLTAEIYVVCKILEYFIAVIALVFVVKKSYKPLLDFGFLKRELKYGNIIFGASLFGYLNYRIDQVMIKFQLGDSELGVYSVAVSLAELIFLIPNSFTSAITGKLLNSKKEDESTKNVLCLVIKGCFYLCIGISIIAVFCTPLITVVYGEEYAGATSSFLILLIGVCFASLGKVMFPYYTATGRPKIHMRVTAIIMVANIIFNFIFIPKLGIDGAALGSTLSYIMYGGLYLMLYKVKEKIPFRKMLLLSREDIRIVKGGILNENRLL